MTEARENAPDQHHPASARDASDALPLAPLPTDPAPSIALIDGAARAGGSTQNLTTPSLRPRSETLAERPVDHDDFQKRILDLDERRLELRAMLLLTHQQLMRRDQAIWRLRRELDHRAKVIQELQEGLSERTVWAEHMTHEAEQRGQVIQDLQHSVGELTVALSAQSGVYGAARHLLSTLVRGCGRWCRHKLRGYIRG